MNGIINKKDPIIPLPPAKQDVDESDRYRLVNNL